MPKRIKKLLIANRGEIAVRIIRACKDLGITAVAVYSDADRTAYHIRLADEAYHIGPSQSSQSYLVHDKIIDAAKRSKADAIHPGYGFLSENSEFAKRCERERITFIGPSSKTIKLLGDKIEARKMAVKAGLPIIPGTEIDSSRLEEALKHAQKIGFPILVKATAGGGGKGMRIVNSKKEFEESIKRASSEAQSAFGDGRVFIEKFLERPRHIEIQILSDKYGNAIHLGERECSIQRRHQKLIEESPSPIISEELRREIGEAAINIAKKSNYVGAGTVEFMYDDSRRLFYFLEVNTRLQVEHPVTEMVTGIDLVKEQIAIAEGRRLSFKQSDIKLRGHAFECRILAEDPNQGFVPSTGKLKNYRIPAGPGVRVDSGVVIFSEIPVYYDPLFAKLIVWGQNRYEAISRMKRALGEFRVAGVTTTIGLHREILQNKNFVAGKHSTKFLEEEYPKNQFGEVDKSIEETAVIAAALEKFINDKKLSTANGKKSNTAVASWISFHRLRNLRTFTGSK
ncbi:MAG: acetyl-CoA carboxylase biotin carboxylase subunit [Candidatus Zixiibacteriota bacterium]